MLDDVKIKEDILNNMLSGLVLVSIYWQVEGSDESRIRHCWFESKADARGYLKSQITMFTTFCSNYRVFVDEVEVGL